MIKELFTLAKMLFRGKPGDIESLELLGMDHIPFSGYKYMSWCGRMIYRNDMLEKRQQEWLTKQFEIDKNHETIHLMQAKQCGSWVKYYWRYFIDWMKGNPLIAPASAAYYTSKYESEAYANEENLDYCKNYDGSNLKKYTFKNRKKLYKSVGGTSKEWKAYVKSL